jgi:hypothetical protein
MFRIAINKLFKGLFYRVLTPHHKGPGSIPDRDMSVLGPLVYNRDCLGQVSSVLNFFSLTLQVMKVTSTQSTWPVAVRHALVASRLVEACLLQVTPENQFSASVNISSGSVILNYGSGSRRPVN